MWWFVLFLSLLAGNSLAVSPQVELLVRRACRQAMVKNKDHIAGFIRLIFSDCVAVCDGCININQPMNYGLGKHIKVLQEAYEGNRVYNYMSRADFWALCAVEAVQVGYENSGVRDEAPRVSLNYGRVDCQTDSPYTTELDDMPDPRHGLNQTLAFFRGSLNLNPRETVALLGAHTLGRCRPTVSGYEGSWTPNIYALDNSYFVGMTDNKRLEWNMMNKKSDTDPRWQWVHGFSNAGVMLNSDMSLLYDIKPDQEGRVKEELESHQESFTAHIVKTFASDNGRWLLEFGEVFTKLLSNYKAIESNYAADEDQRDREAVFPDLSKRSGLSGFNGKPIKPGIRDLFASLMTRRKN